jgi:hypothetical protein
MEKRRKNHSPPKQSTQQGLMFFRELLRSLRPARKKKFKINRVFFQVRRTRVKKNGTRKRGGKPGAEKQTPESVHF